MSARIGSLFSGYGGLDMGATDALGGSVAWHCETDRAASAVLAHHWPHAPNLGDISTVDWSQVEPVDVLTGGFPCQDVSQAGMRAGMNPGTRSGLWAHMAHAIDRLRPGLVVIENVRGLLSARADRGVVGRVECGVCDLDDDEQPALRALGAVLGDLADIGYDAAWQCVSAASIGAPHKRVRVFITAWPAADAEGNRRNERRPEPAGLIRGSHAAIGGATADAGSEHRHERGQPASYETARRGPLREPARRSGMGTGTATANPPGIGHEHTRDAWQGRARPTNGDSGALTLLPTPAVNDMGAGKSVADWDEWRARMRAKHGNGNGHGASLAIEAVRIGQDWGDAIRRDVHRRVMGQLSHASDTEEGPHQVLRELRSTDAAEAVRREPDAGGHGSLPRPEKLFAELRQHEAGGDEKRAPLAGEEASGTAMLGVPRDDRPARSPHRPEPQERRSGQSDHAVQFLPSEVALAGRPGEAHGYGGSATSTRSGVRDVWEATPSPMGEAADLLSGVQGATAQPADHGALPEALACGCSAWGQYAPVIHRWETVLQRPAPAPTELSPKGFQRLSPRAVEFMMGLPAGHVTGIPGLNRNDQLRLLGNGVVPQQATAALNMLSRVMA